jgi:hypothetical protein
MQIETLARDGRVYQKVFSYETCTFMQRLHAKERERDQAQWTSMGLIRGSAEWWAAIKSGRIPVFERCDVIQRVYFKAPGMMARYNLGKGPSKYAGFRFGEPDSLYEKGRWMLLRYVILNRPGYPPIPHPLIPPDEMGMPEILEEWIETRKEPSQPPQPTRPFGPRG